MNKEWNDVKRFHKLFNHPHSVYPVLLDQERISIRSKWMCEEIEELIDADSIYEQADAIIDLIYFALGTLVEMGVRPKSLFDIVQDANMNKMWSDGIPRYDKDGKVIKPSSWKDPHTLIKEEIDRQKSENNSET